MIESDLTQAINNYNSRVNMLWGDKSQCGQMFEALIADIVSTLPNLRHSVGDHDYLTSRIGGHRNSTLQVDAHIRDAKTNELVACVESKCYIDLSMLKRAVQDFTHIHLADDCTKNTKFIIFAGQKAFAKEGAAYYGAWLKELTKKDLYIFIVNDVKQRHTKRPIHEECFGLDIKEIENFRNLLAGVSGLPGLVICQVLLSL